MAVSRPLKSNDVKTLTLASLGGTLEFYDFVIYVFFAKVMGHVFFPSDSPDWLMQLQTYGIFAAGYLARPLGGVIMAHFGDLNGRKRMFTISIVLMALPTFFMGLLPTYTSIGLWAPAILLLLRILQGAAIGGEIPGAWVFVAEHAQPDKTGFACGTLTAGLTMGILLGSVVASTMYLHFSPAELVSYAWRIPFILGGLFGLIAIYLRSYLHETPVFQEMAENKRLAKGWPLKHVLAASKKQIILSMLATWLLTGGIVVVILMTPSLLGKLAGVSDSHALLANCLAVLTLSIGCILAGSLTDRIGNGVTLLCGSFLLLISSYLFYGKLAAHPQWLYPGYAILGLFVGVVSTVPCIMVRIFPPAIRFSGLSFSYNLAYAIFGGLTPMAVALMLKHDVLAPAHYVAGLCVLGMLLGIWLMISKMDQPAQA